MEINIEQFKIWLTALRSGQYPQGQLTLQSGYGYCCLGVACKVLIPEDKLLLGEDDGFLFGSFPEEQPNAPEWLKLINQDFRTKNTLSRPLSHFNDRRDNPLSFETIADLLEKAYLKPLENEN